MSNIHENQTTPATAIHASLRGIAIATAQVADHVLARPSELEAVTDSAKAINKQFTDLIDATSGFAEGGEKLRGAAAETAKATDWIGEQYSGRDNNPDGAIGRMSDFN